MADALGHQQTPVEREEAKKQAAEAEAEEQYHRRVDRWTLRWSAVTAVATGLLVLAGLGATIAALMTLRAIQNQVDIQTASMEQWVEVANWKARLVGITDGDDLLWITFEIMNPTPFPLTIKTGRFQMEVPSATGKEESIPADTFFTPKTPYEISTTLELSAAESGRFNTEVLSVKVVGYITHSGVLKRKPVTQVIAGILSCSQKWASFQPTIHTGPREGNPQSRSNDKRTEKPN